jgi:hypothetical protein
MQTLHSLCSFRDLRAVSPGQGPRRQRPHPMRASALEWKGASPLPNLPRPICAIGWRTGLTRCQDNRGACVVPGLLAAVSPRWLRNGGPCGPVPQRVCRVALVRQTALSGPLSAAPHVAEQREADRAGTGLASLWTPAPMPPFAPPAQPHEGRQAVQKAHARTLHPERNRPRSCWLTIGDGGVVAAALVGLRRG